MRKLLIATQNKGKVIEIREALKGLDLELVSLADLGEFLGRRVAPEELEVEETAETFEGNALIKAIILGNRFGMLTLADDSGLEVDALGGRPGVYSARYCAGSDEDRYRKLLKELKDVPEKERTARFVAVVAVYDPQKEQARTWRGVNEGQIATEPRGTGGFGYDPVFYLPSLDKTEAEITLQEKDQVSHRGRALRKARDFLGNF